MKSTTIAENDDVALKRIKEMLRGFKIAQKALAKACRDTDGILAHREAYHAAGDDESFLRRLRSCDLHLRHEARAVSDHMNDFATLAPLS